MELNSINSLNLHSQSISKESKIETMDKVSNNINSEIQSEAKKDTVEQLSSSRSPFASNIMNSLSKIENIQNIQSSINIQLEIANKMESSTQNVLSSTQNDLVLDDIQPEINSLLNKFNTTSKNISTEISGVLETTQSVENTKSRMYFDGVVGSKPLSAQEIFDAVSQQKERLSQINEALNSEIINTTKEVSASFKKESEVLNENTSMKNTDFKNESVHFTSQSLKAVEGDILPVQAHAQTEENIKLLAS